MMVPCNDAAAADTIGDFSLLLFSNLNWMSQTLVLIQNLKKCTKFSIWYINWHMRKTTSIQIKTHFWKSHRNTTKNYSSLQKQTLLSNRSYSRMLWRYLRGRDFFKDWNGGRDFFTNSGWGGQNFFCGAKWWRKDLSGPKNNGFPGWCAGKLWPLSNQKP